MNDNLTQVLMLLITSATTFGVAWLKVKGSKSESSKEEAEG